MMIKTTYLLLKSILRYFNNKKVVKLAEIYFADRWIYDYF